MEHIHIAALRPSLDALESKQIQAVVTLIWPYSSSQRQFALLLAEPDLRLRRKRGQVRARFSSTSARALATTGVGIGDEVVLSLQGAQFAQDSAVSTPGKSIDWELAYAQTVAISVRRHGAEIARLELLDAAPTPAPGSPVKAAAPASSPMPQWSSPAFLKRARLSDGPLFAQPAFDPLADAHHEGHDKKRRRKSYRDWTAWTYTTRTPSPEKEDVGMEDDMDEAMSSPSRPPQLPKTPISPSRTAPTSVAAEAQDDSESVEETTIADSPDGDTTIDDGELQKVYAPLCTSPGRPQRDAEPQIESEDAPLDSEYDFGGDTELNTEDEDEDEDATVPDVEAVEVSATEVATELEDESEEADEEPPPIDSKVEIRPGATEEDSLAAVESERTEGASDVAEDTTIDETVPGVLEPAILIDESLTVAMPPPSLPLLNTDFAAPRVTELLTPIGREPSSPNLKAVDSATLPLPSPFPGEQVASYFEHISAGQQQAPLDGPAVQDDLAVDDHADYILENSFFSSISSSKAGGLHQDHETAFTPVRFAFGMDGAGWSRPLDLSSPPPEDAPVEAVKDVTNAPQDEVIGGETRTQPAALDQSETTEDVTQSSLFGTFDGDVTSSLIPPIESAETQVDVAQPPAESSSTRPAAESAESFLKPSNVLVLSSDVESGVESDETEEEDEDAVMADLEEAQSSEEETESEREEDVELESEQESEPEFDEADAQQIPSATSQDHVEPENTSLNVDSEAEDEQPRLSKDDAAVGTQTSTAVSEVVDLGSHSGDEVSDADADDNVSVKSGQAGHNATDVKLNDRAGVAQSLQQDGFDSRAHSIDEVTVPEDLSVDDVVGMEITQKSTIVLSSSPRHLIRKAASIAIPDTYEEPPSLSFDDWKPQLGMDEPLPFIEDHDAAGNTQMVPPDAGFEVAGFEMETTDTQADLEHPDVKMESVENSSLYSISQSQQVPQESATDPATELLTAEPEKSHKFGERQLTPVPATAPARNTRSKAKTAASPTEEDGYVSRISTSMRRTRSKASFDSTNRDTTSPTQSRGPPRSTVTPTRTREAAQTSPYRLRSQSKQLSPDKSVTASRAPIRKSPRKLVRRDTDFDIVPSQVEDRDLFGSMFEPSQELGFGYSQLSQGRHSDVGFVKDSEEDTSHSEGSISTVQYSDDDGVGADLSDSVEVAEDLQPATSQLKPPPSFLQSKRQTRSRSRSMGQQSVVSPVQPPQSPRRSPRLTRSTFSPTPSPRVARTTKAAAQVSSPVPEAVDEDQGEENTPKAKRQSIAYPALSTESEGDVHSSPQAPPSAQQSNFQESNLLTPDGTQQTAMEPPLSFQARQREQSLLITPEFTQQMSANATLRSFDIPLPGIETQPAPRSPVLRTSPRRKLIVPEGKSSSPVQESSPIQQSSDAISADDQDATLVTKPEPPSIGLSTPLAYYTPLRDLIYFLNRSSQFHSSSNPDILALCTSASTAPEKAKKGPRHWHTTLHITDLSIWPAATTVSVFRAYQSALPVAEPGDVVLLRAFAVESRRREPVLRSADESSWCVWRYGKPVWGKKGGRFGEVRAREEIKGPVVERGVGEWGEVVRLREWYVGALGAKVGERVGEEEEEEEEGGERGTSSIVGEGGVGEGDE